MVKDNKMIMLTKEEAAYLLRITESDMRYTTELRDRPTLLNKLHNLKYRFEEDATYNR
jgi:hypothetical protein